MRIAFIVDKSSPRFLGGYETRVWHLAAGLADLHDVRVYTSLPSDRELLDGVQFIRIAPYSLASPPGSSRSLIHSAVFAAALVRNPFDLWMPDVVYIEAIPYVQLLTMQSWANHLESRKILNVNEAWSGPNSLSGSFDKGASGIVRIGLSTGVQFADQTIAISHVTARSLERAYRLSNVPVIPMGVSTDAIISPVPVESREIDFIALGRQVRFKRTRDTIAALAELKRGHLWTGRAVIAGAGPELPSLVRSVKDFGIESQVRFVAALTDTEKFDLLGRCKCFVLASEREGFSVTTLEAMSCGCVPIVAVPPSEEVFGVSEIVEDGANGVTYPLGDVPALTSRLWDLVSCPSRLSELSIRARRHAERYSWENVLSQFQLACLQ